jgi:hypothetical protein
MAQAPWGEIAAIALAILGDEDEQAEWEENNG